jgi:CheY-like chemotaxis protein
VTYSMRCNSLDYLPFLRAAIPIHLTSELRKEWNHTRNACVSTLEIQVAVFYRLPPWLTMLNEMKILIVEDNAMMRPLLGRLIMSVTKDILECDNGANARTLYADHRLDLVLMDINMPEEDGISVTRSIRKLDHTARVLFVTLHDDEALRHEAVIAGACGYTTKANLSLLSRVIRLVSSTKRGSSLANA